MVTVSLAGLWLNDATDPTDALFIPMNEGSAETWPTGVQVRTYAGGRKRAARGPRGGRSWTPVLPPLPMPSVRWLQAHAGDIHWARDLLGGRVACVWDDAPATWIGPIGPGGVQMATVTLRLDEVDHDETGT